MRKLWAALVIIAAPAAVANPVNDQLAALPEDRRLSVLQRMMAREGERCESVTRAVYQGSASDGSAFWSLSCRPGDDWQVMFGGAAGTDVKILPCRKAGALGGAKCFQTFKR